MQCAKFLFMVPAFAGDDVTPIIPSPTGEAFLRHELRKATKGLMMETWHTGYHLVVQTRYG
jgi:hypothetical protein